jgi:hypothetical protein
MSKIAKMGKVIDIRNKNEYLIHTETKQGRYDDYVIADSEESALKIVSEWVVNREKPVVDEKEVTGIVIVDEKTKESINIIDKYTPLELKKLLNSQELKEDTTWKSLSITMLQSQLIWK